MFEYLYRKRFGLKIAWANRKEGDRVGAYPSIEPGCGDSLDPPLACHTPSYWLRLFLSQTFSRINTRTFSNLFILHTYLPMKMEQTECSETSAYKIQTPGNYPEESIQHSEDGESLKWRNFVCWPYQAEKPPLFWKMNLSSSSYGRRESTLLGVLKRAGYSAYLQWMLKLYPWKYKYIFC
jgi:hypothetical protein